MLHFPSWDPLRPNEGHEVYSALMQSLVTINWSDLALYINAESCGADAQLSQDRRNGAMLPCRQSLAHKTRFQRQWTGYDDTESLFVTSRFHTLTNCRTPSFIETG